MESATGEDMAQAGSTEQFGEFEAFSEQLTNQIEYNNKLLEQLHEHEQQQLYMQQRLQDQQNQLFQYQTEVDRLRRENAILKRDLTKTTEDKDSFEQLAQASGQERDNLLEEKRQADHKLSRSSTGEAAAKEESNKLRIKVDVLAKQLADVASERHSLAVDSQNESQELRDQVSTLVREKDDLNLRVAELESEVTTSRERISDYENDLREASSQAKVDASLRTECFSRQKAAEDNSRSLAKRVSELEETEYATKTDLREATAELNALRDEHQQVLYLQQQQEAALETRAGEDTLRQRELESVKNELRTAVGHRDNEIADLRNKLAVAKDDFKTLSETSSSQLRDTSNLAAKQANEAAAAREEMEGQFSAQLMKVQRQYSTLQAEHSRVHEMLQAAQKEKTGLLRDLEEERRALDKRASQARIQHQNAENQHRHRESELREQLATRDSDLNQLMQNVADRTQKHLHVMGILQEALRQVTAQNEGLQRRFTALSAHVRGIASGLGQVRSEVLAEEDVLRNETRRLMEEAATAKEEQRRVQQMVGELELRIEQERSRTLSAVENASASKDLAKQAEDRATAAEETARAGAEETINKLRAELKHVHDKDARSGSVLSELRQQLEAANVRARSLQEDNDSINKDMVELQKTVARKQRELDAAGAGMDSELEGVQDENGQLKAELAAMRKANEDLMRRTSKAENNAELLEERLRSRDSSQLSSASKLKAQGHALAEGLKKYQAQLSQTQGLLLVVQEQRKQLQQENAGLRNKLQETLQSEHPATSPAWRPARLSVGSNNGPVALSSATRTTPSVFSTPAAPQSAARAPVSANGRAPFDFSNMNVTLPRK